MAIEFNFSGLDALQKSKRTMERRLHRLIDRLAEAGANVASASFATAQYDGTNDTVVTVEWQDNLTAVIKASGQAVLFIEFGTGVTYEDDHPEKPVGMERGKYGKGRGSDKMWGYYGDPGTNGQVIVNKSGREVVLTEGNPASKSMYEARKHMEDLIREIAIEELTG